MPFILVQTKYERHDFPIWEVRHIELQNIFEDMHIASAELEIRNRQERNDRDRIEAGLSKWGEKDV